MKAYERLALVPVYYMHFRFFCSPVVQLSLLLIQVLSLYSLLHAGCSVSIARLPSLTTTVLIRNVEFKNNALISSVPTAF